jgi:hypothetical protein
MAQLYKHYGLNEDTQDFIGHALALYVSQHAAAPACIKRWAVAACTAQSCSWRHMRRHMPAAPHSLVHGAGLAAVGGGARLSARRRALAPAPTSALKAAADALPCLPFRFHARSKGTRYLLYQSQYRVCQNPRAPQRDDSYLGQPALPTVMRIKLYHDSLFRCDAQQQLLWLQAPQGRRKHSMGAHARKGRAVSQGRRGGRGAGRICSMADCVPHGRLPVDVPVNGHYQRQTLSRERRERACRLFHVHPSPRNLPCD